MTKYVLQSGGMKNAPEKARQYFAELVKGLGDNPKILVCFFAQPREVWEEKFPSYKKSFNDLMPDGVRPTYEMAMPDTFEAQVTQSDAIYCHGGDDHLAQYWFRKVGVPEVWDGKVVGTNSATTNALAINYWTYDWRELGDGLGVLPIKTIVHYESEYGDVDPRGPIDWEIAKQQLENYGDTSLPIHALHEGGFIVIEQ